MFHFYALIISERKIKKTTPLPIIWKIEYLEINLTEMKDLVTEKCKTQMKGTEHDTNGKVTHAHGLEEFC